MLAGVRQRSATFTPQKLPKAAQINSPWELSHWNCWRSLGDSNPCFRRERAKFSLIVPTALAPAPPRPHVWLARAYVHRGRAAPHSCSARAADRRTDSSRSRPRAWPWRPRRASVSRSRKSNALESSSLSNFGRLASAPGSTTTAGLHCLLWRIRPSSASPSSVAGKTVASLVLGRF